jgi:hypothetical protein
VSSGGAAEAARAAYRRRVSARARRARAETQTIRLERERLALAHALRRELETLAKGAADLARTAQGQGRAAERARVRLWARRRRTQQALVRAERFSLELGLAELDPQDREALGLPDA